MDAARLLRVPVVSGWRSRRGLRSASQADDKRPAVRLGLAIGPDRIIAVELLRTRGGLRPGRVRSRAFTPPLEDRAWPKLTAAVSELLTALSARGGTASIALLRPLAHAKAITVPPVGRSQVGPLVAHNASRYFIVGDDPVVADAVLLSGVRRTGPARALAVCAKQRLVDAIYAGVSEAGLHPESITAASLALTAALRRLKPDTRRSAFVMAVCSHDWMEGVAVQRGLPRFLEPWSHRGVEDVADLTEHIVNDAFGEAMPDESTLGTLVLAGSEKRRGLVEAQIRGRGGAVLDGPGLRDLEPAALAAFGAAVMPEGAPHLLPAGARRERRRREVRRVALISTAAAVVFSVAAGFHLWGAGRELDAVTAERQALAVDVREALELRGTAAAIRVRLEAISRVEATIPHWTSALAALAQTLPDSAYLVSLNTDGLQLRLAGMARSASSVVPALQASPL
ncbi:MAG: PilN domain-containing protein, partial [Myxococcota bacterium]